MYETCSVSCHHHMTTVRVWLYPLKNESCSVSCHHLMTTARARLFISKVWNMLGQLSSSHDNGESMVIYHIHVSLKTCLASCLRLMTTDKAWLYIPKIWIMPHKLSSSHDNGKSMITPPQVKSCSVSCHHLMTTVRAWLFFSKVCNMLCQVSSSYDNDQSMEIYHSCMKHAPSVAIVLWQWSEHGNRSLRYQSCSVSCHRLMTTDRAWLYIPKVWNLLCQLSMSHHNVQSMVIYP